MKFIEIKESELKEITLFLIKEKVIFHPKISPKGVPDFAEYTGQEFVLLLDRNLLVRIIRLITQGELKDDYSMKLVSSLLLWAELNNIEISSGIALVEYSHFHKKDLEASHENNLFLEIFKQYNLGHWLNLALGRQTTIPQVKLDNFINYNFYIEDEHFKMHYLELLKIAQLYFDNNLSTLNRFENFHKWVFDHILICKYTTYLAVLIFGQKSKVFRNQKRDFDEIIKKCTNQAWDLTYLSFWSTLYYYEENSNKITLFATLDKELKELFMLTHEESVEIYKNTFGKNLGNGIIQAIEKIYVPRDKPSIDSLELDEMIQKEEEMLKQILK